jgi:multiple sugar transport system permease protein
MALVDPLVKRAMPSRGNVQRRENLEGWLLASPWVVGFIVFTVGPMIASAYYSLTRFDLLSPPQWVGLQNYASILSDDRTLHALKVTSIYSLVGVPLRIVLGLAVALLLNAEIRGLEWYRTIYYLPAVLSGVAVALLWKWVLSPEFGLLNLVLSWVGIQGPAWLVDRHWALWALILMSIWGIGGGMVIYLAGLQGIPTELYEAAAVDGATAVHRFFHVTLPMLSPVLFFQLIMGIIQSLQTFVQGYVMTGGGPNDATLFFMLHLYNNAFWHFKMGYASAMAWILFAYIMLLTLMVLRSSQMWVFYQGALRGEKGAK